MKRKPFFYIFFERPFFLGQAIYIVNREKGDSSRSVLENKLTGFKEINPLVGQDYYTTPEAKEIEARLAALTKPARMQPSVGSARDAAFDTRKGLQILELACVPGRLVYTKDTLTVNAGQPVKLILRNPDATQHNIAILTPGTPIEEIGAAANEMAKSIEGFKKHFIPDDQRILHATKLVDPESVAVLRFIAPEQPGIYPYLCTFPGHWILMKGKLVVR